MKNERSISLEDPLAAFIAEAIEAGLQSGIYTDVDPEAHLVTLKTRTNKT
jgi:hypothetical protein